MNFVQVREDAGCSAEKLAQNVREQGVWWGGRLQVSQEGGFLNFFLYAQVSGSGDTALDWGCIL